jgi:hypothetical protein
LYLEKVVPVVMEKKNGDQASVAVQAGSDSSKEAGSRDEMMRNERQEGVQTNTI